MEKNAKSGQCWPSPRTLLLPLLWRGKIIYTPWKHVEGSTWWNELSSLTLFLSLWCSLLFLFFSYKILDSLIPLGDDCGSNQTIELFYYNMGDILFFFQGFLMNKYTGIIMFFFSFLLSDYEFNLEGLVENNTNEIRYYGRWT